MTDYDRNYNRNRDMSRADAPYEPSRGTRTMPGQRAPFRDYVDRYRSDWEGRYGSSRPWSEYEEGFRFGWYAGQHDRFRGRDFRDAESDLERDWPQRRTYAGDDDYDEYTYQGESTIERRWDDLKDAVREGFERARVEFEKRT
ncbi:MAG TPA: hypothetical protein VHS99_22595 [Chloroflexota bacterium]|nr:hypothetical protein [Chloroflexota bacterium]